MRVAIASREGHLVGDGDFCVARGGIEVDVNRAQQRLPVEVVDDEARGEGHGPAQLLGHVLEVIPGGHVEHGKEEAGVQLGDVGGHERAVALKDEDGLDVRGGRITPGIIKIHRGIAGVRLAPRRGRPAGGLIGIYRGLYAKPTVPGGPPIPGVRLGGDRILGGGSIALGQEGAARRG
eukprot:1191645-Prorocentrum_minimum.AAC.2